MSDVSLSKAVRSNLLSLQNTASMMAKTQERLATGNKVNSALDNPTNFFTASSLNSRAGDMGQLLDSMANGIQTLEAADNGLSAITKNLESMQSTLRQARQDKSFQTASYTIDANAIGTASVKNLTFEKGAFGNASESVSLHNTVKTGNNGFANAGGTTGKAGSLSIQADSLNGGTAVNVAFTADDTAESTANKINATLKAVSPGSGISASVVDGQISIASSNAEDITLGGTDAEYVGMVAGSEAATAATVVGSAAVAAASIASFTFTINGEEITTTATAAANTAAQNGDALAAEINASDAAQAAGVQVTNAAGVLTFTQADGENFTLGGDLADLNVSAGTSTNGILASGTVTAVSQANAVKTLDSLVNEINNNEDLSGKIRASNDNGKLRIENLSTQDLDIDGVSSTGAIDGSSSGAASILGNSVRADLAEQYNELRDQLDKLSDDASFNGVNLLRGDNLKITFNETGTSELDIQTKDGNSINAGTLGLETNLEEADLDSDANIDSLIADVKSAIGTVRAQSSSFGSSLSIVENRQDFTKNMINTLESGAGNLTLADTNEEAANLLALQTRQQLSSTALSMASQADQAVLRLF